MKNILHALEQHASVFVELPDTAAGERFQREANTAGFRFGDGAKPTERDMGRVMAVHANRTVAFPGICGHIACQCGLKPVIRFEN